MINILYIIEDLNLGGAERVVITQARSLDKNKFDAKVCCLRQKGEFAHLLEEAGIKVIVLGKKPGIDLSIISKTMKIIKDNKIDVVHTHLWVANFWGRIAAILARVPVVITEHNVDVWKKWHHKVIDMVLACFTKKVCVVSEQVKKFYVQQIGIKEEKIEVVYNGIEALQEKASPEEIEQLRNELKLRGGVPLIVNIGRLVPAKAQHIFIEALDFLNKKGVDFKALVVGEGLLKQDLGDRIKGLGLDDKVILTDLRKDVATILDVAAISVLSSTREGLSIVVLESMAKGVPFVATDVGGNREQIVDGETGFLVSENDPAALAEAIEKILKDDALAQRMGMKAKERVKEYFSIKRMMKKMEEIYEKILTGKKSDEKN